MSAWNVLQIAVDFLFFAGIGLCIIKLRARREEDPRLSYGLKLLQNKIAVLEDLSDKTEVQVKQLVVLLERKMTELQQGVQGADAQLARIDQAMGKTLEVATIFQEQVPHQEILERKVANKYINAARLAHQGVPSDQIQQQIDLPQAELDLIVKLNKENLTFSEEHLPAWVEKHPLENNPQLFEAPKVDMTALEKLGEDFRKACKDFEDKAKAKEKAPKAPDVVAYQFKKQNDYL
jgi:hypothetical protein